MIPAAVDTLADAQDCVVSRAQLRSAGVTRSSLRRHVGARRWRLAGPRVVVLHTGPLEGGAESFAEIDAVRLARRVGIPPPRRRAVRTVGGRRRYLDAEFEGWVMEIDGGVHLAAERHAADLLRQNALVLAGDRVLRFAAITVPTDPASVRAHVRRAHEGWGRR